MSKRGANIVKTKGKVSISRVTGFDDEYISIQITDVPSGVEVAHLKMDFDEFAKAITGEGRKVAELTIFRSEAHGLKLETKSLPVFLDWDAVEDRAEVTKRLKESAKQYETDGWISEIGELNSRRYNHQRQTYETTFYRHVEVSE